MYTNLDLLELVNERVAIQAGNLDAIFDLIRRKRPHHPKDIYRFSLGADIDYPELQERLTRSSTSAID